MIDKTIEAPQISALSALLAQAGGCVHRRGGTGAADYVSATATPGPGRGRHAVLG